MAGLALSAGCGRSCLLLTLTFGLLLVPDDFTNTTGKGPRTPEQARILGALLLVALVTGTAWLWQSRRPMTNGAGYLLRGFGMWRRRPG